MNTLKDGSLAGSQTISDKQKAAGNYEKAHRRIGGMRVSIENAAGSDRKGTDPEGNAWTQKMRHDYGYIRGSTGYDKDHIDAFIGPDVDDPDAMAHVIDQNKKGSDDFDESKVMLGFKTPDDAVLAYHENYPGGWDGFRGVTSMPVNELRDWAMGRKSGQRKPAADYVRFKQDQAIERANFASGGGVQASKVTRDDLDSSLADLKALEPYIAGPKMRRQASKNDNKAAADMPISLARGVLAGTAGLPGDLEGLVRGGLNARGAMPTPGLGGPVVDLIKKLVGPVNPDSAMPTSDFYNEWLPGRIEGPQQRFAEGVGNLAGMDPLQAARLVRPAGRLAEKGLGALGQAAEQLYNKAEPAISSAVDATMGRGGKGAQLLTDLAQGSQSMAVKSKGGNWSDAGINKALESLSPGARPGDTVADWLNKRLASYVRNDMGTATDPLLKLEQQGRLHFTPEDLQAQAAEHGIMGPIGWRVGDPNPGAAAKFTPVDEAFHQQATGRDYATPWEALTDSAVDEMPRSAFRGASTEQPWMDKLPDDASISALNRSQFNKLGFDHVRDYLKAATGAGVYRQHILGNPEALAALGQDLARRHERLTSRGLDINPDDLSKMSLSDVVSKSSDWNSMLQKAQALENMNKGVKSVVKQYPSGHQWVELAPEGLAAEGDAMRHCVGGYCDSVQDGTKRILSLRDSAGKPYTTVELSTPDMRRMSFAEMKNVLGDDHADALDKLLLNRGVHDDPNKIAQSYLSENNINLPWNIQQIKGPANRAPSKDVLPMVQDFVKNMGPWGDNINDLQNTGLRYFDEATPHRGATGQAEVPQGYHSADDLRKIFNDSGMSPDEAGGFIGSYFGRGYASGGRVNLAAGGTVVGNPTVGLGTFQTGGDIQGQQSAADAAIQRAGTMTGMSNPTQSLGSNASANGRVNTSLLPSTTVAGAPSYDLSTPYGQMAIGQGIGSMGAGDIKYGVNAFLPGDWQPYQQAYGHGDADMPTANYDEQNNRNAKALGSLAQQLGYDTTGYDLSDWGNKDPGMDQTSARWDPLFDPNGFHDAAPNAPKNLNTLFTNMNNDLKDYRKVKTASAGWDNKNDPRGTATALYKADGSVWNPVSAPQFGHQAEDPGWIKGDGADLVSALSMVLPAFGGWAGILGQGTAGTLSAGAGLGVTGSVAPSLVNAGMGYLTSGGNAGSLVGSLGSYAGGALGNYAGGAAGQQLGSALGSKAAQYLYGNTKRA